MLCELNVTECHQNVAMNVTRLGVLTKTQEAEEDEMVEEAEGGGSVLKSTCSCTGPKFGPQHPHQLSHGHL